MNLQVQLQASAARSRRRLVPSSTLLRGRFRMLVWTRSCPPRAREGTAAPQPEPPRNVGPLRPPPLSARAAGLEQKPLAGDRNKDWGFPSGARRVQGLWAVSSRRGRRWIRDRGNARRSWNPRAAPRNLPADPLPARVRSGHLCSTKSSSDRVKQARQKAFPNFLVQKHLL